MLVTGIPLNKWEEINKLPNKLNNVEPLFSRIDIKQIDSELEKLKKCHLMTSNLLPNVL